MYSEYLEESLLAKYSNILENFTRTGCCLSCVCVAFGLDPPEATSLLERAHKLGWRSREYDQSIYSLCEYHASELLCSAQLLATRNQDPVVCDLIPKTLVAVLLSVLWENTECPKQRRHGMPTVPQIVSSSAGKELQLDKQFRVFAGVLRDCVWEGAAKLQQTTPGGGHRPERQSDPEGEEEEDLSE